MSVSIHSDSTSVIANPSQILNSLTEVKKIYNKIWNNSFSESNLPPFLITHKSLAFRGGYALSMEGIALLAHHLAEKNKLTNLFVCRDLTAFATKLKKVKEDPQDQRLALIIYTDDNLEELQTTQYHKLAIGVEKRRGHVHICIFETVPSFDDHEKLGVTLLNIDLSNATKFSPEELLFHYINTVGFNSMETSFYYPFVHRLETGGCSTFAMRDAVAFLKDPSFFDSLPYFYDESGSILLSSGWLYPLKYLPAPFMKVSQSIDSIDSFAKKFPLFAKAPMGKRERNLIETMRAHLKVRTCVQNESINTLIEKRNLKYQQRLIEILQNSSIDWLQAILNRYLLVTPKDLDPSSLLDY